MNVAIFRPAQMKGSVKGKMDKRPEAPNVIQSLNIKKGITVLDFGCGEGNYTIPVAEAVGGQGKVYALDKKIRKLRQVERKANRQKLTNIKTILSEGEVDLDKDSVDIVLLFDVLHHIDNKQKLLNNLYNILKPDGLVSIFPHHHITREELIKIVSQDGIFILSDEHHDESLYNFRKGERGYNGSQGK